MNKLYATLTLTATMAWIPEDLAIIIMVIASIPTILSNNMLVLPAVGAVLWVVGAYLTSKDPDFFHILWTKYVKIRATSNWDGFKGRRYLA